ncbi:helix-turn-helix domain-containing protein [Aquirufa lenticrescens]|uniref:helix-turn-helix domain-containing protein n=1 Tax=Aquirufa lenticrescens TaxID=2696560 RepID=UPI001CAA5044|nr:AraC family transcriptional regulator [Aquirufa lenticrescens]UAJ14011.1 helix-turn-helix transcriptional regulator [Aquirufa lenticrescens]
MILYISLFSIITSAIIAIYNWRINPNALLLTGIFGIFSTYGLTHYFTVYHHDIFWTAIFYGNLSPLWYLPGPMLYVYTRNTITDKSLFSSKKDYLHLLPFLIQAINISPYLFSTFDFKLQTARLIIENINNVRTLGSGFFIPPSISFVTRPSLVIIYAIASVFLLQKYHRKEHKNLEANKQNKLVYNWLFTLILVTLIVALNFLVMTLDLYGAPVNRVIMESEPTYNISGIAFALLPLVLIVFFPQILYGMPIATSTKKAAKLTIMAADPSDPLAETAQIIVDYINNEKPYLNPDFDLEDLSEKLDIPKHHIIYCFTIILQKKFTAYRSTVRIEYAKTLLNSGTADTLSIDGIGSQSGFSSRSGFYATFKAETGMTPSQYLETL